MDTETGDKLLGSLGGAKRRSSLGPRPTAGGLAKVPAVRSCLIPPGFGRVAYAYAWPQVNANPPHPASPASPAQVGLSMPVEPTHPLPSLLLLLPPIYPRVTDTLFPPTPQVGFKLLAYEVRLASGYALKAARGEALTRWVWGGRGRGRGRVEGGKG